MQAQPVIQLDGTTVARTRTHIVTHAFGQPMPKPYTLTYTEWRRPSRKGEGYISSHNYTPSDPEIHT